ncbi:MAG: type II secretion system F family protein [Planctomycetota bacterium]
MTKSCQTSGNSGALFSLRFSAPARLLFAILLAISTLTVTGCGGCGQQPTTTAEEEEEQERPKDDFENRTPVVIPAVFPVVDTGDEIEGETENQRRQRIEKANLEGRKVNRVKAGHWATAYFQVIANNFDGRGVIACNCVDAAFRPVPVEQTDYYVLSTRPASMPKGQWRNLETTVYLPRRETSSPSASVKYDLRSPAGLTMTSIMQPSPVMNPHQYHFVVLSHRPDSYKYMNNMDVVTVADPNAIGDPFPPFYYVVPTRDGDPVPLPRHALSWTTLAYVLWDDYAADELDTDQQIAMLDWIHHGGQLIISGPDSLDGLQNSFLADYLPAFYESAAEFTNADLEELNENFAVVVEGKAREDRVLNVLEDKPLLGINLNLQADASPIEGTGDNLIVERQVGRGRIVVTAFSLEDKRFVYWRSFNSLFNNAIMRRPARRFSSTLNTGLTFRWKDDDTSIFDPLIGSQLRFLSRDLGPSGTPTTLYNDDSGTTPEAPGMFNFGYSTVIDDSLPKRYLMPGNESMRREVDGDTWRYGGYRDTAQSGVAGWSDSSGVSMAARTTLKQAAGITPPPAGFVFKMLAGYLIVLVPLNWLIFRMIGRVEWAWVAAPLIAIAGAALVIKMASLDIGFVRSNTQVNLLEVHADYPRGHLTEYSALYTSLSTGYNVELANQTAQSLPFAANIEDWERAEVISQATLNRTRANRLEGFQIKSNSTGMLHTESMIDMGGSFSLTDDGAGGLSVVNGSTIDLVECGVVQRRDDGTLHRAWIGDLMSGGQTSTLEFEQIYREGIGEAWQENDRFLSDRAVVSRIWQDFDSDFVQLATVAEHTEVKPHWEVIKSVAARVLEGELDFSDPAATVSEISFLKLYRAANVRSGINLGDMFDAVSDYLELAPGEVRLIGATGGIVAETAFDPGSTQVIQETLVVVHLNKGRLPPVRRDWNTMADAIQDSRDPERMDEMFGTGQ